MLATCGVVVAMGVGAGLFTTLWGAVSPFGEVPGIGFGVGGGLGFVSLIVDIDVVVKTSASATALAGKTAYTEHTSKARSSLLREPTKDF